MNDVSSIFFAIYSRRIMVMLVLLGSVGAGFFYSKQTPSEYLSVAKILIPATSPTVSLKTEAGNIPNGPIIPDQNEDLRIGIIGIIRSGAVHDRVALALPGIDPKTIRKNVVGDIGSDSFLHVLSYAKTREEAAMLANAFSDAFEDEMQSILAAGPKRTLESFIAREPIAWQQFSDNSTALVRYLEGANFTDIEVEAGNMLARRQVVQRQIERLELQHSSNLAQRPVYEQLVESRPEFVVTGQSLSENSVYKSALERSSQLATELALKKLELTDKHPEVVRLTSELSMVQTRMSQQAEMTHSSSTMSQDPQALIFMQKMVEIDIAEASYDSQKTIFEETASKLDSELQGVPEYRAEVSLFNAKILQSRNHAEDISARIAELEFHIKHGFKFTMTNEYTEADPDKALGLPTPVGIMIFSTLAGLIVGILAAVVSELVKQMRLRSPY